VKTVFISAGHGGGDPGATSPDRRFIEADLALRLRDLVAARLRSWLVNVVTDGRDGINLPLRDAIELAKRTDGPAVEIHFNAGTVTAAGVEVLCHRDKRPLAQDLAAAVAKWTRSPLRGEQGWRAADSGQHHRLGFCNAGGLILEVEFITNPAAIEAAVLHEKQIAAAVAAVLAETIKTSPSSP
jgi:N-acetylmuramoyl-L-alanine amidase